jgi:hypothetical protein
MMGWAGGGKEKKWEEREGGPRRDKKKKKGSWAATGPKEEMWPCWARRKGSKGEKV